MSVENPEKGKNIQAGRHWYRETLPKLVNYIDEAGPEIIIFLGQSAQIMEADLIKQAGKIGVELPSAISIDRVVGRRMYKGAPKGCVETILNNFPEDIRNKGVLVVDDYSYYLGSKMRLIKRYFETVGINAGFVVLAANNPEFLEPEGICVIAKKEGKLIVDYLVSRNERSLSIGL